MVEQKYTIVYHANKSKRSTNQWNSTHMLVNLYYLNVCNFKMIIKKRSEL